MLITRDRSILSSPARRPKGNTELAILLGQKYWFSGDPVSVGVKSKKEVFPQGSAGGATGTGPGSFQTAAALKLAFRPVRGSLPRRRPRRQFYEEQADAVHTH